MHLGDLIIVRSHYILLPQFRQVLTLFFRLISFVLTNGGTANLFWGFIVCSIGLLLVYASLAEMASMYVKSPSFSEMMLKHPVARAPTAGGQYHWVSEFAPPSIQKPLSYIVGMLSRSSRVARFRLQLYTGWLCTTGWQVFLASVAFIVGTIIQGLIVLNHENYVYRAWHGTLFAIAVISFSIIFNTSLATRLPLIEGVVLIIHVTGLFAVIIPLWVLAPTGNAYDLLFTFTNNGGWPSTGLSAMIGLASPFSCLLGYDCSVHMCMPSSILPTKIISLTHSY